MSSAISKIHEIYDETFNAVPNDYSESEIFRLQKIQALGKVGVAFALGGALLITGSYPAEIILTATSQPEVRDTVLNTISNAAIGANASGSSTVLISANLTAKVASGHTLSIEE